MTTPLTPPAPSTQRGDEQRKEAFEAWYKDKNGTNFNDDVRRWEENYQWYARGTIQGWEAACEYMNARPAQAALSEEEIDTSLLREAIAFHEQGWTPFSSEIELYVKAAKILIERMKRALTAAQNRGGR